MTSIADGAATAPEVFLRRLLPLVSAIVLSACAQTPTPAPALPQDEAGFTREVAARLQRAMPKTSVEVRAPLTIAVGSSRATLDRIHDFCRREPASCSSEVDRYVAGIEEAGRLVDAPPAREDVRVVVRTADYMAAARAALGEDAPLARPIAGDLFAMTVLDGPSTIRSAGKSVRDALGLTQDELHALGIRNLRRTLPPLSEVARPSRPGTIGNVAGDAYESSRLLLHEDWSPLASAQGGVLVVAVPAKDVVLYVGEDSAAAVDALRTLAKQVARQTPAPLSDLVLRWTPDGWVVVP